MQHRAKEITIILASSLISFSWKKNEILAQKPLLNGLSINGGQKF